MAAMVDSLAQFLVGKGEHVTVAGMGSEPHVRAQAFGVYLRGLKHRTMTVRALYELLGALLLAKRIRSAIGTKQLAPPALIIAFQPSLFLAITSHFLKRWYGSKLYLVQRDILPDWLIQSGRLNPGVASWGLNKIKGMSLTDADRIGIECEENLTYIEANFHPKACVLDNWRSFSEEHTHIEPPPAVFTLIYGGRIGFAQGFDRFLDALIEAKLPKARLHIFCDDRGSAELTTMRRDGNEQMPVIEVLPMLPEPKFLREASWCSMGVVSLSPDMRTHNIPGKLLGYLAAGIPIFAIGPKDSALRRVVKELGIGVYVNAADKAAIIAELKKVASNPDFVQQLKNNAIAARSRFAVETAAAEIGSIL